MAGRTVIVVDNGVATGNTAKAASRALRQGRPRQLVLAVPVAEAAAVEALAGRADEVVCLHTPGRLRSVDKHVRKALGPDPAPLLLAGEPHVVGNFRPVAHLPNMLDDALLLNPFALSPADLHARTTDVMSPLLDAELNAVLEQVRARLGTAEPTVGIRVEEILAAAGEARIDSVVVAHDEALWGRFDPLTGILVVHGHQTGAEDDLLNQVAVIALRTGARAYAVPVERLPRHSPAVATYRF